MSGSHTLRLALTFYCVLLISYVNGHVKFHPSCPQEICTYVSKECRLETTYVHEGIPCEGCPINICGDNGPDTKLTLDRNNGERPIVALLERLRRPGKRDRPTEQRVPQERHNRKGSVFDRDIFHDLPPRRPNDRIPTPSVRDPSHDSEITSNVIDNSFFSDIPLRHLSRNRPRSRSHRNPWESPNSKEPIPWNRDAQRDWKVESARSDHLPFSPDLPTDHVTKPSGGESRIINHDSIILQQTETLRSDTGHRIQDVPSIQASDMPIRSTATLRRVADVNEMQRQNLETVSGSHGRNDMFGQNFDALQSHADMLMRNLDAPGIGSSRNNIHAKTISDVGNSADMNDMLKRNLDTPGSGVNRMDALEPTLNNIRSNPEMSDMLRRNLDAVGSFGNSNDVPRTNIDTGAVKNDMLIKNLDATGSSVNRNDMLMRNLDTVESSTNTNNMPSENIDTHGSGTDLNPSTPGLVPIIPINPFDLGNFAKAARTGVDTAPLQSSQSSTSILDTSQQLSSHANQNDLSSLFEQTVKSEQQSNPSQDSTQQELPPANVQTFQGLNTQLPVQPIQGSQPSFNQQQLSVPSTNTRIMPVPIMQPGFNGMIPNILGVPFSPIQMQVISTLMSQMRLASGFTSRQFPQNTGGGFPSNQLPQNAGTGFPANQPLPLQQNRFLPFPNGRPTVNLAGSIPPIPNGGFSNFGASAASFGNGGVQNTGILNNQVSNGGLAGVAQHTNAAANNLNTGSFNPQFPNGGQTLLNVNSQVLNGGVSSGSLFPFPNAGTSNTNFANQIPQLPFPSNPLPQSLGMNFNLPQNPIPNTMPTGINSGANAGINPGAVSGINPGANAPELNTITPTAQRNQASFPQTLAPGSTFAPGSSLDDELHRLLASVTSLDADGQFLDGNGQSVLDTSLLSSPLQASAQGSSPSGQSQGSVNTQTNGALPLFDMLALVNTPQNSASPNLNSVG